MRVPSISVSPGHPRVTAGFWLQPSAPCPRHRHMELHNRLHRSRHERMVAGVAGGIAEYADVDPTIVRLIWIAALLTTGPLALLLYVLCAIVIPREPGLI